MISQNQNPSIVVLMEPLVQFASTTMSYSLFFMLLCLVSLSISETQIVINHSFILNNVLPTTDCPAGLESIIQTAFQDAINLAGEAASALSSDDKPQVENLFSLFVSQVDGSEGEISDEDIVLCKD
jgi:hypothetical protein